MKASEFYKKYWRIQDANGNMVVPRDLTKAEEDFLDNQLSNEDCKMIILNDDNQKEIQINKEDFKSRIINHQTLLSKL